MGIEFSYPRRAPLYYTESTIGLHMPRTIEVRLHHHKTNVVILTLETVSLFGV